MPRILARFPAPALAAATTVVLAACDGGTSPSPEPLDGRVAGQIRIEGSPLADARVGTRSPDGAAGPSARSDAEGSFQLTGLTAGTWSITVEAPPGVPAIVSPAARSVTLSAAAPTATADLSGTWRRDAGLDVAVAASGTPVTDATVRIEGPIEGWGATAHEASTDAAGRVAFSGLVPGTWTVTLTGVDPAALAFDALVTQAGPPSGGRASVAFAGTRLPVVPEAPGGLSVHATGPDAVEVTWSAAGGEVTHVQVERRAGSAAPAGDAGGASAWAVVATLEAGATAWTDTGLTPGSTWQYRVRACNEVGCSETTAEAAVTTPAAPPAAPSDLQAWANDASSITVVWNDRADHETSLEVDRAVAGGGFEAAATLAPNTAIWTDEGLAAATHHRYRVRACGEAGCSDWSNEAGATTEADPGPPPPPPPPPPSGNPADLGPGASLNGWRPFPGDNPWNTDVSGLPVDPKSATLISACGDRNLHPDFGTVWNGAPIGIPYVVVDASQTAVPVSFDYASESDPGPYPIPPDAPIEGGSGSSGDRHVLVIDRDAETLYEVFDAHPVNGGASWTGGSGAVFDLNSNALRPAGWTSADAAGLPIFPGLVRYDEAVERGAIEHALRFTCPRTRRAYVHPARHWASSDTDPDLPPMGMRVRLKASFDIAGFPDEVKVILRALKTYGMFLADNGSGWYISGAPDPRWDDSRLGSLKSIPSSAFEVVQMGAIVTP